MWGFIALIILVSIAFGVSLHSAFWGIIGVTAGICAIGLLVGTELGRKITKWSIFIIACGVTAFGVWTLYKLNGNYDSRVDHCKTKDYSAYVRYTTTPQETKQLGNVSITYGGGTYADYSAIETAMAECLSNAENQKEWELQYGLGLLVGGGLVAFLIYTYNNDSNKKKDVAKKATKISTKR